MNILEELGNLYSPTDTSVLNLAIGSLINALNGESVEAIQGAVTHLGNVLADANIPDATRQLLLSIIDQINTTIVGPPVPPPSNTHGEKPKTITEI